MLSQHNQLIVRPPPIAGRSQPESITSWLFRLASANGFATYGELLHNVDIVLSPRTLVDLEPDRWALLARLHQLSGISANQLRHHTLNAPLLAMTGSARSIAGRWLMPSGGRGCRYAVCTACLAEDATPYWRSAWRVAVSTVCPVHGNLLVDACRGCAKSLVIAGTRMASLRCCEHCGRTLHHNDARSNPIPTVASWRMVPAQETRLSYLPVAVAHSKLWWDGVRVLLNVLQRPRIAAKLHLAWLPRRLVPVLNQMTTGSRLPFDHQSIAVRHQLLDFVDWLTKDWPARFVRCMNDAHITRSEFSTTEVPSPYWLWSVCKEHLERKRYWLNVAEVSSAVALLNGTGRPVTKLAIKRLLGVTEGKALDKLHPPMLRRLSHTEMLAVTGLMNADLAVASTAREKRASMLRDACSISAAAWLRVPLKSVALLTMADGASLLKEWRAALHEDGPRGQLAQTYLAWMEQYLQTTRVRFERYEMPQRALFLSRYGVPTLGFGLAARLADLLRRAGVKEWKLGSRLLTSKPKDRVP